MLRDPSTIDHERGGVSDLNLVRPRLHKRGFFANNPVERTRLNEQREERAKGTERECVYVEYVSVYIIY